MQTDLKMKAWWLRERIALVHSASLAYEDESDFMYIGMGPDNTGSKRSNARPEQTVVVKDASETCLGDAVKRIHHVPTSNSQIYIFHHGSGPQQCHVLDTARALDEAGSNLEMLTESYLL